MRIDAIAVMAAAQVPAGPDLPRAGQENSSPERTSNASDQPAFASPPVAVSPQHEVNVTIDDSRHTIYRIVDTQSGDLVQQVPPEELLRVMRNIGEMLQESQQKLNLNM